MINTNYLSFLSLCVCLSLSLCVCLSLFVSLYFSVCLSFVCAVVLRMYVPNETSHQWKTTNAV